MCSKFVNVVFEMNQTDASKAMAQSECKIVLLAYVLNIIFSSPLTSTSWPVVPTGIKDFLHEQDLFIECNCLLMFSTADHEPCSSQIVVCQFSGKVIALCNKKDSVCGMACKNNIRFLFPSNKTTTCSEPYHVKKHKSGVLLPSSCNVQCVTRSYNTLKILTQHFRCSQRHSSTDEEAA